MLGFHAVIVSDYDAGFGAEEVRGGGELGEEGDFGSVALDVEGVGVEVEGVEAVGVRVDDGVENGFCFGGLVRVEVEKAALGEEIGGGGEEG